jgi:hypothetical protein
MEEVSLLGVFGNQQPVTSEQISQQITRKVCCLFISFIFEDPEFYERL